MTAEALTSESVSVGVISDTHGLLRAPVLRLFARVDLIVHAGDVGKPDVLRALEELAPVRAVRGNNDHGAWADALPASLVFEASRARVLVLHDLHDLDFDPAGAGFHAVIAGHSHKPSVERRAGVLLVNPGSAGPRRFKLPIACARLTIHAGKVRARLIEIREDG